MCVWSHWRCAEAEVIAAADADRENFRGSGMAVVLLSGHGFDPAGLVVVSNHYASMSLLGGRAPMPPFDVLKRRDHTHIRFRSGVILIR